jgi:hypothetical protein
MVVLLVARSILSLAPAAPAPESAAAAPAPAAPIAVEAAGECPSREAVAAALAPVLGGAAAPAAPPRVTDLGDKFEVSAAGQTQQYVDTARDCEERAREAAVFIALALRPPTYRAPAPPPAPPADGVATARARPPVAPTPVAEDARWGGVAIAARFDGSAAGDSSTEELGVGAELRGALGRGAFGVVASAGILAPNQGRYASVVVRQQRFPLGLAVATRRTLARDLELGAAVGLALVPFHLNGNGLSTSTPSTRLDTGARVAVELRRALPAGRMSAFLDFHAEYFPRPYVVEVDPLGDLGSTGRLWIGAAAGVWLEAGR